MRKWTGFCLAISLLITAFFILPIHAQAGIYDNVIRLHVLANSDSEEDQVLKLKVRDAVLAYTQELLCDEVSLEKAQQELALALPEITQIAKKTLREHGAKDDVYVTLDKEEYPRRSYEAAALPAGEYLSLRVMIGEAEGQNWWCVLFPSMCLSAASEDQKSACLSAGLTEEQYRLITETEGTRYKLRFKIVELAERFFD